MVDLTSEDIKRLQKEFDSEYASTVKMYRVRRGFTGTQVGEALGVGHDRVSQWEVTGRAVRPGSRMKEEHIQPFCEFVGASARETETLFLLRRASQGDIEAIQELLQRREHPSPEPIEVPPPPPWTRYLMPGAIVLLVVVLVGVTIYALGHERTISFQPITVKVVIPDPLAQANPLRTPVPAAQTAAPASPQPNPTSTIPKATETDLLATPSESPTIPPATPTTIITETVHYYASAGDKYYQSGSYEDALAQYKKVFLLEPASVISTTPDLFLYVNTHISTCNVYYNFSDYDNAAFHCEKALKYTPDVVGNYPVIGNTSSTLGYINYFRGEYNKSIGDFSNVVRVFGKESTGYYGLGINFIRLNNKKEAISNLQRCVDENSDAGLVQECQNLLLELK